MFGFDRPEDGSHMRFRQRFNRWFFEGYDKAPKVKNQYGAMIADRRYGRWIGRLFLAVHHFWWIVHNCISHPLIGIVPIKVFFDFHDWTSHRLNYGDETEDEQG